MEIPDNTIYEELTVDDVRNGNVGSYEGKHWRQDVFLRKGCKCVACGIEGTKFVTRRHFKEPSEVRHLDLYAFDGLGESVLMTVDHIHPKSKGGPDHINNLQTMCTLCNNLKGNGENNRQLYKFYGYSVWSTIKQIPAMVTQLSHRKAPKGLKVVPLGSVNITDKKSARKHFRKAWKRSYATVS